MTGASMLWVVVVLPAVVGAVLCLAGRQVDRAAATVAVAVALLDLGLAAALAAVRPHVDAPFLAGAPLGLGVDALSALLLPTVAAVTLLVLVFAGADIRSSRARFHGLMLLFAAAVTVTVTATTMPALLLAWEVMGATSYALIGFRWRDSERVAAGAVAFLTTRTADMGLYLAAAAALAGQGGLSLAALSHASPGWRHVVAAGVLAAGLGKAAQLPFAFWLSRAMRGPSPVSALLHSAAMVAMGGYLLLRTAPLLAATGWADDAAAWTGAITAVALGAVAMAQRDLKQLLAASTCAQLGFVVLAAGVGSVSGGVTHLVAHAAVKALLFLAAGAWLSALGTKQLPALRGVARRWPVVGVCASIGALALAGLPPLSLWATKDAVLAAARQRSLWLYLVGLAGAALSAAYAGKAVVVVWQPIPTDADVDLDAEQQGTRHVGWLEKAPLLVLALGAAGLGVLALPPVGETVRSMLGDEHVAAAGSAAMAVSALLAVVVIAAVRQFGAPEPKWAADWLRLEPAAGALVVRPTVALSHAMATFDDRVLDRSVEVAGRALLSAARHLARFDRRGLDAVVETVARLMQRLAVVARRLQTGQIHHYYLQAVAVVAAGAVVLLAVR